MTHAPVPPNDESLSLSTGLRVDGIVGKLGRMRLPFLWGRSVALGTPGKRPLNKDVAAASSGAATPEEIYGLGLRRFTAPAGFRLPPA